MKETLLQQWPYKLKVAWKLVSHYYNTLQLSIKSTYWMALKINACIQAFKQKDFITKCLS